MCEMAVKEGVFDKRVGLKCPQCHKIIKSFSYYDELPYIIECEICELNEEPVHEFLVEELQKITYYKLRR